MTLLIAIPLALVVGFVAGARTHRRRLQTSYGRHRSGITRPTPELAPITELDPALAAAVVDAAHTTVLTPPAPETTAIPLIDGSLPRRPQPVRLLS